MRRAEKAGRERAEKWIAIYLQTSTAKRSLEIDVTRWSAPSAIKPHEVYRPTKEDLGAHQLHGRALQAALEAYDRGYRARLTEALNDLMKKERESAPLYNQDKLGE